MTNRIISRTRQRRIINYKDKEYFPFGHCDDNICGCDDGDWLLWSFKDWLLWSFKLGKDINSLIAICPVCDREITLAEILKKFKHFEIPYVLNCDPFVAIISESSGEWTLIHPDTVEQIFNYDGQIGVFTKDSKSLFKLNPNANLNNAINIFHEIKMNNGKY